VSIVAIVMLVAAAALVVGAEWPRFSGRLGSDARKERDRAKRKKNLRVVPQTADDDSEEFARAVERDLASLPTIDERDAKRR